MGIHNVSLPGAVAAADGVAESGVLLTGLAPPGAGAAGAVLAVGELLARLGVALVAGAVAAAPWCWVTGWPGGRADGSAAEGGAVARLALDRGGQRLARGTLHHGDCDGPAVERGCDDRSEPGPARARRGRPYCPGVARSQRRYPGGRTGVRRTRSA
jgi:hypothetical protein